VVKKTPGDEPQMQKRSDQNKGVNPAAGLKVKGDQVEAKANARYGRTSEPPGEFSRWGEWSSARRRGKRML